MHRRDFLMTATATAALGLAAGAVQGQPVAPPTRFGFDEVVVLARGRAAAEYRQPLSTLTGAFKDLNYDQYRAIRFRRDLDPFSGDGATFGMDLLPPGLIFYEPVKISVVRNGQVQPISFSPQMLDFDDALFPPELDRTAVGDMGWSGFRLRTTLNRPDVMDEFLVFQGASYFRAVARDTLYGLSARGLAIRTGSPQGEEFPLFTDFWVHEPQAGEASITIHAILDSKSVAGAYEFVVTPGVETTFVTRIALFPRVDLEGAGIAPLTSMFWFGPASPGVNDYRPSVHDSDGLQMETGAGMHLWRLLGAHKTLQISGFVDSNPRGFGLVQRARSFADYQDAEAGYHLRPSVWIEPSQAWGQGEVRLIEIPVENEFNDNIVSYWTPAAPLAAGQQHDFGYRMTFGALPPERPLAAQVVQSRAGKSINGKGLTYIVDFELALFQFGLPQWSVTASSGTVGHSYVKALPDQNVLRLSFEYEPGNSQVAELTAVLNGNDGPLSETWMARWSR
ncbi:glucan biosynthesis protein [Paracoccus sp. p4-l81]|uniref:glucan biosynthesis protein n=1 Tax=Paracoccus sp. p4-l81 TaxID=3342806 RepID=UPI0035B9395A